MLAGEIGKVLFEFDDSLQVEKHGGLVFEDSNEVLQQEDERVELLLLGHFLKELMKVPIRGNVQGFTEDGLADYHLDEHFRAEDVHFGPLLEQYLVVVSPHWKKGPIKLCKWLFTFTTQELRLII